MFLSSLIPFKIVFKALLGKIKRRLKKWKIERVENEKDEKYTYSFDKCV